MRQAAARTCAGSGPNTKKSLKANELQGRGGVGTRLDSAFRFTRLANDVAKPKKPPIGGVER